MISLLRTDSRPPPLLGAVLLGLTVFVTGKFGVDLSRLSDNVAAIWLTNAIPLAILLARPRREWWLYAAAAGVANLAMNALHGDGFPLAAGFAVCNVGEFLAAAALLDRFRAVDILSSLRSLLLFFGLAAVLSTGVAAALGAVVVSHAVGAPFLKVWSTWWIADAVGMIVVTPALAAWFRRDRHFRLTPGAVAEYAAIAAGLATATYLGADSLLA